jgi:hypothetical protein
MTLVVKKHGWIVFYTSNFSGFVGTLFSVRISMWRWAPVLQGEMKIHQSQLFWCSPQGTRVLTHPNLSIQSTKNIGYYWIVLNHSDGSKFTYPFFCFPIPCVHVIFVFYGSNWSTGNVFFLTNTHMPNLETLQCHFYIIDNCRNINWFL